MVRNGKLRKIKVYRGVNSVIIGTSRDDAHQYKILYYPLTQFNKNERVFIAILFNKYRSSKRQLRKTWNSIDDVYENRQELIRNIFAQVEDFSS